MMDRKTGSYKIYFMKIFWAETKLVWYGKFRNINTRIVLVQKFGPKLQKQTLPLRSDQISGSPNQLDRNVYFSGSVDPWFHLQTELFHDMKFREFFRNSF